MKKKSVLWMIATLSLVAAVNVTTNTANAEGFTQATNADMVDYGTLSAEDVEVMATMFDFEYYKLQNPELVKLLGDDYNALFNHFCSYGIFEGRTCNWNFDPSAYSSAYGELKAMYGNDIAKYYIHYATVGKAENRTLTTLQACAHAGIPVTSLADSSITITPQQYRMAEQFGLKNFSQIQSAIVAAQKAAEGNTEGAAVIAIPEAKSAYAIAKELTKVGEITVGDQKYELYIVKGQSGYGAYHDLSASYVYATENYVAPDDVTENVILKVTPNLQEVKPFENNPQENGPYYEVTTKDFPTSGVEVSVGAESDIDSVRDVWNNVNVDSTATYELRKDLVGEYVKNGESLDVHRFQSEAEKSEYMSTHSWATVTYEYIDVNGTNETVYDIGMNIEENGDGTIAVSVGISNDDNQYGHVMEYEKVPTDKTLTIE
jgi:hypothetical protein